MAAGWPGASCLHGPTGRTAAPLIERSEACRGNKVVSASLPAHNSFLIHIDRVLSAPLDRIERGVKVPADRTGSGVCKARLRLLTPAADGCERLGLIQLQRGETLVCPLHLPRRGRNCAAVTVSEARPFDWLRILRC